MNRMLGKIKSTFLQFKKPTDNIKEIIKLSLWIFGSYLTINLLSRINSSLAMLPNGLFLVLFFNLVLLFIVIVKAYLDILIVKAQFSQNKFLTYIYATHSINKVLFCVFIIIYIICLATHF